MKIRVIHCVEDSPEYVALWLDGLIGNRIPAEPDNPALIQNIVSFQVVRVELQYGCEYHVIAVVEIEDLSIAI